MKVSIALHRGEPDFNGNQRDHEAAYQNYNRHYADLIVDPVTGHGFCAFDTKFPMNGTDSMSAHFFSLGTCIAPQDLGGYIIIYGPITGGMVITPGDTPHLDAAAHVDCARLLAMALTVVDGAGQYREKTEDELKVTYPKAA